MFKFIDRWVDRIESMGREKATEAHSADILAARIVGLLGNDTGKKVLLTGDAPMEHINHIKDELAKRLSGTAIFCSGDIMLSPDCINFAEQCDGIVLVIRKRHSTYPTTKKQLDVFKDMGKPVMGFVTV